MPSPSKKSYGSEVQARATRLLKSLLEAIAGDLEEVRKDLTWRWADEDNQAPRLTIETTLQALALLSYPEVKTNTPEFKRVKQQVGEALGDLRDFVEILDDHRVQKRGASRWRFTLRLWSKQVDRNLVEFDKLWESKRSPHAKSLLVAPPKPGLKPEAPCPRVRLPDNFVARPEPIAAVKRLLTEDSADNTVVVSAIAGLGGLGKSVLATALVLDEEVRQRFVDGILWVTLGQNPDLQNLLGDWIRELDKSRESYAATTLESASRYLHTLLLEKRVLLVVDDAWNAAHVEHFRVGGAGCRVLVTTREAQIGGADYYSLDLMTEGEAIALVRQKLGRQWRVEQEPEVRAFANSLGYLPLALDLSANLVQDGLSWGELRSEFEAERRAVALELLDSTEAFEHLLEEEQRKYSLKACFNLSLKRLNPEQLRQFAWLGVLPEDVKIDARMAVTLWGLPKLRAKKVLIDLCGRSFLTRVGEGIEGEPSYRVHDLMHDTARGLIEQGALGEGIPNLSSTHGQLLERYRSQGCWHQLVDDGYIYRHLTWHFVQAGWEDALHDLLAMSDELERNAWFEACDRIGEPGVFVQDVKRGWAIAEELYGRDALRAIVLQCRYALVMGTLNSVVERLPAGLMTEFMKRGYWTPRQTWAYVEQMQSDERVSEAIQALAPYLPDLILKSALRTTRLIRSNYHRALAWSALLRTDCTLFPEALEATQMVRDEYCRAIVLSILAQTPNVDIRALLATAQKIQNPHYQKLALDSLDQPEKDHTTDSIKDCIINPVIKHYSSLRYDKSFGWKVNQVKNIQSRYRRSVELNILAQFKDTNLMQLLEVSRAIQDEVSCVRALLTLLEFDNIYFLYAVEIVRSIQNVETRAEELIELARIDKSYCLEAVSAVNLIQDKYSRANCLIQIVEIDKSFFSLALDVVLLIQGDTDRVDFLTELVKAAETCFSTVLDAVRLIKSDKKRFLIFRQLRKIDASYVAYFSKEEFEATDIDEDDNYLSEDAGYGDAIVADENDKDNDYLSEDADDDEDDFPYLSNKPDANRLLQKEFSFSCGLNQVDQTELLEALEEARLLSESSRVSALNNLATHATQDFLPQILQAIHEINHKPSRAEALSSILPRLPLPTLLHPDWCAHLHLLAHRDRASLVGDLATLHPAILRLGGEAAVRGMVDAMRDVCSQWK